MSTSDRHEGARDPRRPADCSTPEETAAAPDDSDQRRNPVENPSGPRLQHLARAAGIYLVFSVGVSLLALVALEISWIGLDWAQRQEVLATRPWVIPLTGMILLLGVLAVLAASGRMWITATLVLGLVTLLGVASRVKYDARREPVYPGDLVFLREPGFLLHMVEPRLLWLSLLGSVVVGVFGWGLGRAFKLWLRRRPTERGTTRQRVIVLALRASVAGLCLLLLFPLLDFNSRDNPWRKAFEAAGAHWRKASQPYNYRTNGFVGGFLYNMETPAMARPRGYSEAALERIIVKYTDAAQRLNQGRSPEALEDVNVVVVLSESFSDPTRLRGVQLGEDPIPRTRALMEQLPHGSTLSPKIGAGTSSMEFETLTGMSLAQFNPVMDTPYQMLIPKFRHFPSSVELFNQLGHDALAIHPNTGTLYQRRVTYPILGFSDFIELQDMRYKFKAEKHLAGAFVSDAAAYREVLDAIESNEEPLFLNLVTMQNHTPFSDKYADPVEVSGLSEDGAEMLGQYSRGLAYSDRALARFIRDIDRSEEKTLMVFYGDHLPAGLPEEVFAKNSSRTVHETPFFLYSNFRELRAEELPTTSPVFFLPRAFDAVDAPLPPYYALLREVEQHVTAMEHGMIVDSENETIARSALSPEARAALRDYRLVQYDLSVGQRYAEEMLYPMPGETLAASGTTE